jgi:glycosyltransferase involved in cell wall biosynthesis
MALGVTVLAGHNTGAASEVVENCGLLVDTRNLVEMSEGLVTLIGNPDLREKLERAGKERVRNKYSDIVVAKLILDCYRQIIYAEKK